MVLVGVTFSILYNTPFILLLLPMIFLKLNLSLSCSRKEITSWDKSRVWRALLKFSSWLYPLYYLIFLCLGFLFSFFLSFHLNWFNLFLYFYLIFSVMQLQSPTSLIKIVHTKFIFIISLLHLKPKLEIKKRRMQYATTRRKETHRHNYRKIV